MAERRMFNKNIIDSDAFLEMPMSARLLYYDLAMRADDDGFVNSPRRIMRMIGATQDDANILIMRSFIIPFDSGIVVIKHWRIHNYIRNDRYTETIYKAERSTLTLDENKVYQPFENAGIPTVDQRYTTGIPTVDPGKVSIDKISLGKVSLECDEKSTKKFIKPALEDVKAYCEERKNGIDAQHFIDYYSANGWKVGKNPMKDWKAAIRYWERNGVSKPKEQSKETSYDLDEFEKLAGTLF